MQSAFIATPAKFLTLRTRPTFSVSVAPLSRKVAQKSLTRRRENVSPQMSLIPFVPNWIALGGWAFGAYRFYLGFYRTSYQSSFRLPLAIAWPLLFIVNPSYRKNFKRSIGASDDD